jgi:2-iminobutanoate/2-iminopropanoate deaminase
MQIITAPSAPTAIGPYSHAVRTGNLLFCSGQIPIHPQTGKIQETDVEGQMRQVLANVEAVLSGAGLAMWNVVKATMFLQDMDDFPKVNALYAAAFGAHKPARSTIQIAKLPLGALVELEVIAEFGATLAIRDE